MADLLEPIVFLPIGRYGSIPTDFYGRLATDYAANLYAADDIRQDLEPYYPGWQDSQATGLELREAVRTAMEARVVESLEEGRSVIHDGFVNHEVPRRQIKDRADKLGARAVVLFFKADRYMANARVKCANEPDATPEEQAAVPTYLRRLTLEQQIRIASNMERRIQKPNRYQKLPLEEVVIFRGHRDTTDLLTKLATSLER